MFFENVVDLDTASRVYSIVSLSHLCQEEDTLLEQQIIDTLPDKQALDIPGSQQSIPSVVRIPGTKCPVIALFGFMAAFPSVAHKWFFAVLHARKWSVAIISILRALYRFNAAFSVIRGTHTPIFLILSGVI